MTGKRPKKGADWPKRALFLAPAILLLSFFFVVPALGSLYFSLTDQKLVGQKIDEVSFIGFDNYIHAFQDRGLAESLVNSLILLAAAVVVQQAMGFAAASLLEDKNPAFKRLVHACVYAGWLMPEAAVAFIFSLLFSVDGLANQGLGGFGRESVAWLIDRPLLVIALAQMWSGTACSLVAYESALESMPEHIADSARADGAGDFAILSRITLPAIRTSVRANTASLVLGNLGVFGLIYMLTGGGPVYRSTNLPVLVFRDSVSGADTGYGLALSFVLFCLSVAVSVANVRLARGDKGETECA